MSKLSFISTNFATYFLFQNDLPLLASSFELKVIKISCEDNALIFTDI